VIWGMMGKRCWRGGVWNGVGRGGMGWNGVEMGVKGEAGGVMENYLRQVAEGGDQIYEY